MLSHSASYSPNSDVRNVGIEIKILDDSDSVRKSASVQLMDGAFTAASDPHVLIDGSVTGGYVETNSSSVSKNIDIYLSQEHPPEYAKVYFSPDSCVPEFFSSLWYKNIDNSSLKIENLTESDKEVYIAIPEGFDYPTRFTLVMGGSGIKITEVEFCVPGENTVFTENEIISAEITEEVDICAESFPGRKLTFEAAGLESFGLDDISRFGGRMVEAGLSINGEIINAGWFYIDDVVSYDGGSRAKFSCSDIVTRADKFITGLSTGGAKTLGEVINLGSGAAAYLDFSMDDYSANAYICCDMYTDYDSQRDCLQLACQAANLSSIWVNRNGVARISCLMKGTGYVCELHPDDILEYSELSVGVRTDYVQVHGENSSGVTASKIGAYSHGCMMEMLENDFLVSSQGDVVAENYMAAKNCRVTAKLRLRCDPTIEIGDRVKLYSRSDSDMGVFIVVNQKISFDKTGLHSDVTLVAPLE